MSSRMCSPEFLITDNLESYFHPLTPRVADKKVDKVRAFLIIASYFTVIIPLACGIVYVCSNLLRGRATYPLWASNTVPEHQVFANAFPAPEPESPPAQSALLLTDRQFHEDLEAWVVRESGLASEAAERIERAYRNNLTILDLSFLGLKTLPTVIGQLRRLAQLNLNSNQLTALPVEICQLYQLKRLYLESNRLTTLSAEIGLLGQLIQLNLNSNQLTAFPVEIAQLSLLRILALSENQLTTLPPVIGQLVQLQTLSLYANQLTTVPAVIGQLVHLQNLDLSLNQLTTLPAVIGQLRQLQLLVLSRNRALSEIPIALCNLLDITYLDVDETSIPPAQRDLVLAAIQVRRSETAEERLPPKLNLWKSYAQRPDFNLDILIQAESENLNSSKFNRIEPNTLEIVSNSRC